MENFTNVLNERSLGMTTSKASKNLKTWSSFKRTVAAKSYFNKTTMFLGICKAISEVFLPYTSWILQGQIIRATGRRLWVNFMSGSSLIPGHLYFKFCSESFHTIIFCDLPYLHLFWPHAVKIYFTNEERNQIEKENCSKVCHEFSSAPNPL